MLNKSTTAITRLWKLAARLTVGGTIKPDKPDTFGPEAIRVYTLVSAELTTIASIR